MSIVEATATTAAKVRAIRIGSALPLRTVRGTLAELAAIAELAATEPAANDTRTDLDRAWLRVYVRERPRAGLREDVQALLPRALEVRLDPQMLPEPAPAARPVAQTGHSPRDLFADYLAAKGIADPAVAALFNRLYEEVASP